MAETWWLYMIECKGGGIYTGIAKNVIVRYQQHATGKGARYTKMNPPIALLANALFPSRREAAQEEWRIKQMSPFEKRQWAIALGGCASVDYSPDFGGGKGV